MKIKKMTIFIVMLALLIGLFAGFAAGNTQGLLWGGEADDARTRAAIDDLVTSAKLVTGLTAENAQLKLELTNKNNAVTDLQNQLDSKIQELANKQQELQNKQQEVNDKQQEINSKNNEINALNQQINTLQGQVSALQGQVSALQSELGNVKDERDLLNAMLTKARADMKALADYAELRKGEVS